MLERVEEVISLNPKKQMNKEIRRAHGKKAAEDYA